MGGYLNSPPVRRKACFLIFCGPKIIPSPFFFGGLNPKKLPFKNVKEWHYSKGIDAVSLAVVTSYTCLPIYTPEIAPHYHCHNDKFSIGGGLID